MGNGDSRAVKQPFRDSVTLSGMALATLLAEIWNMFTMKPTPSSIAACAKNAVASRMPGT